jgi:putative ABC transport system permease protein
VGGCKLRAVEQIVREFRLAFRRLRMAPGFTIFAVASLALGVGVSTAVYSAVRTLFWMPLGVPHQDALVVVASGRVLAMSGLDFQDLRAQQTSFSAVAASTRMRTAFASTEGAEIVLGDAVSGDFFTVMQLSALRGRLLGVVDERESARVVVLSERFWRQQMHADPAVVGRSVRLGGLPFEVVGVVRGTFRGLDRFQSKSVWIPASAVPAGGEMTFGAWGDLTKRQPSVFAVWGRLRPGVLTAHAASEVAVIGQRLDAAYPRGRGLRREWSIRESAATPADTETINTIAGMIMTAVGVMLLVACSNLANLALAKGTSRSEEISVRSALGASRWRLVREQLVESFVIVVLGGTLGVTVLYRLVDFFTTDMPIGRGQTIPLRPEVSVEVLAGSAVALLLALLVFGLWPALQATRADVRGGLGSGLAATSPRWRLHRDLVAWQVCGCVALLLIAAMAQRVIGGIGDQTPGVRYNDLAIAQIEFALNARDEAQTRRVVDALLSSLRMQPDIERVAVSNGLPIGSMFATARPGGMVTIEGEPFTESRDSGRPAAIIAASPELFDTIGLRIRRGRIFTGRDDAAAPRVALVSERLARMLFQTTDVVGQTLIVGRAARLSPRYPAPVTMTIVGVSADMDEPTRTYRGDAFVFVPWAQRHEREVAVILTARTRSPSRAVGILQSTIRRVDPELATSAVGTGATLLQGPIFILRVISTLATALGTIAMVLAMAGLFGVLSHVVLRRTREIGIRLALGANRARIFRLILLDGLQPVGKGIVLGLTIGVGARMAVRAWVVTDISAFEPLVLVVMPVPFILAALVACYLPAARASRVDPNVALRDL